MLFMLMIILLSCCFLPSKLNFKDNAVEIALVEESIVMIIGKKGRPNIDVIEAATDEQIMEIITDVLNKIFIIFRFRLIFVIFRS